MIPPSHPRGIGPDPFHNLDLSFHFPCLPNPEDAGRAPATLQVAVHGYGTLIPVLKFMHFPHWTGASSLQTSMQKDVLRSHRMGTEHLLGVPMFLEVLMGSRVALKVWTPDYQHWYSSGNLAEMLILRPYPDFQNQNVRGWGPACVYKVPGDSEAPQSLRSNVVLKQTREDHGIKGAIGTSF